MTEELFINGQMVDLDKGTNITLDFQSNILNDISKIVSSKSYTISLPKTLTNRIIFDNPDAPTYNSRFTYKYFPAKYYRNGIGIITDALAVLMSSVEKYEIVMIWGMSEAFQKWLKSSPSFSDIPDDGTYLIWKTYKSYIFEGYATFGFSKYDTGVNWMPPHPSVRAGWLLSQSTPQGITFKIPAPKRAIISKMLIPLLSRNDSKNYAASQSITLYVQDAKAQNGMRLFFSFSNLKDRYYLDQVKNSDGNRIEGIMINASNVELKIAASLEFVYIVHSDITPSASEIKLIIMNEAGEELFAIDASSVTYLQIPPDYPSFAEYKVVFDSDAVGLGVSFEKYDKIFFKVLGGGGAIRENKCHGLILIYPSISKVEPRNDNLTDGKFYIIPNLPDIKCVDFLKSLCSMLAMFPVYNPANKNTIVFASVDDIIKNKTKAVDWSDRLVVARVAGEPKSVSYRFSDFAQVNYFRYKEDDADKVDSDGFIVVEDETITDQKDIITLPFAASQGSRITQYKVSADDPVKAEEVKVQPRIMMEKVSFGKSSMSFSGLEFYNLVKDHYPIYQEVIRKPVVIKDTFRLDEIDLKTLDFTIPVYVRQYGRYYAIISVQADSSGLCECQLLQLPLLKNQ